MLTDKNQTMASQRGKASIQSKQFQNIFNPQGAINHYLSAICQNISVET
jgi:hypothetical protein